MASSGCGYVTPSRASGGKPSGPVAPAILTGYDGLWDTLADQVILQIRRPVQSRSLGLRLAIPTLLERTLRGRTTARFSYSLGQTEAQPVTLSMLLRRLLLVGQRVDLVLAASASEDWQCQSQVEALLQASNLCSCTVVPALEAIVVVGDEFALVS